MPSLGNLILVSRDIAEGEIEWRDGHLVLAVIGCIFGLEMLQFWFVNGVADFSTAWFVGSIRTIDSFLLRAKIYIAILPLFFAIKFAWNLFLHPELVLDGVCPVKKDIFNLDWFTNAVMLTALPLALKSIGTWLLTTSFFVFGIFIIPRLWKDDLTQDIIRIGVAIVGTILTLWIQVGIPLVPGPSTVPFVSDAVSTTLADETVVAIYNSMNSMLVGPFLVTFVSLVFASVFTSNEIQNTPYLELMAPERTPWYTIAVSSFVGAVVYMALVWFFTGSVLWAPEWLLQPI